jgi:Arc/MetJ-type ribon-helix-helix transcriptional regulator
MAIELDPETEALIRRDVQRGPYRDAADFVEHAVAMLHEQEEWISANRAEIRSRIEEGCASVERGEVISEERARQLMAERKRVWREQRSSKA